MARPLTLGQIASRLGGRIVGDPATVVEQVGSLEHAGARQIAFFTGVRYRDKLAATKAGAVIIAPDHAKLTELPRIVTERPYPYFAKLSQLFNPLVVQPPGIHPSATVASSARLGERVSIGPGCVIGEGATIGDDSCLYPNVVVYPGCQIGKRAIV